TGFTSTSRKRRPDPVPIRNAAALLAAVECRIGLCRRGPRGDRPDELGGSAHLLEEPRSRDDGGRKLRDPPRARAGLAVRIRSALRSRCAAQPAEAEPRGEYREQHFRPRELAANEIRGATAGFVERSEERRGGD